MLVEAGPKAPYLLLMASLPMDTLRVSRRLRDAGFSEPQAEAVALVVSDSNDATARETASRDLLSHELTVLRTEIKSDIERAINPVKADVLVLKWMIGFLLAGVATLIFKAFA